MNAPERDYSMIDVLNDPGSMGARNAVAAATQILDRTGLVKKEQVEIKGPEGGIFILPPKQVTPSDDRQRRRNKKRPNKTSKIPYGYKVSDEDELLAVQIGT